MESYASGGYENSTASEATREGSLAVSNKLNILLPYDPKLRSLVFTQKSCKFMSV